MSVKNTAVLLSIQILLALTSNAQVSWTTNTFNTYGDYIGWNATSGSPPLNIKTTNADPIHFFTNNTQRVTIDMYGNVGVNTSAPNARLHVSPPANQDGILVDNNNVFEFYGQGTSNSTDFFSEGNINFLSGKNKFMSWGSDSVGSRMFLSTSGNIGINTTTPANKLEVNSNDSTATPGNSGLRFTDLIANVSDV